jgi:hypothetical protein
MKQSRFMSLLETTLSTAAGFFLSLFVQWLVLPVLLGVNIPIEMNLVFAAIMTVVSLARQFVLRRLFEALHIRRPLSAFKQAVIAECFRQKEVEGFDEAHDDDHDAGELSAAGAAYALAVTERRQASDGGTQPYNYKAPIPAPQFWPWHRRWWKPFDDRRDLVRAAALIIAEGEKFDRARKSKRRSF